MLLTGIYIVNSKPSTFKKPDIKYSIDKNEWALYNYGQTIRGSDGKAGIDINIIDGWDICVGTKDVIVGLVDTGVYYNSDITQNNLWKNYKDNQKDNIDNDNNGFIDDYNSWDFYNNDNTIYDNYLYDYHGTYIFNTISKVAPNVTVLPCKFLKGTKGDVKDAINAIKYAIDNGATIINCSWSFEKKDDNLLQLIQENKDVLFICAAGNSKINLDVDKIYPACYNLDNLICVLSIDNMGNLYDYSGYGLNVDIAAPGKDIYVTLPENDKTYVDGTSISTAFVSAAASLLKSYNFSLSPLEIKNIILSSSKKLDSLNGKCKTGGCLDIGTALSKCNSKKSE